MKAINSRTLVMTLGGILIATLAAGCFGGGSGYSNGPYGYSSSYSSYGSSYPYSGYDGGYTSSRSYGRSSDAGYQNAGRADENRDRDAARVETQHSSVDHARVSSKEPESAHRVEKN